PAFQEITLNEIERVRDAELEVLAAMGEIRAIVERNAFIADDFFCRGELFRPLHNLSFAGCRGAAMIVKRLLDLDAAVFGPEAQVIIELSSVQAGSEGCRRRHRSAHKMPDLQSIERVVAEHLVYPQDLQQLACARHAV